MLTRAHAYAGGSSGIGLATVQLLLDPGASVVNGDLNESPNKLDMLDFVRTNVADWQDLVASS